jgi:hypothetical protein
MNKIHKAYQVLGIEDGTPFEAVKTRHKQLAFVWHPDRMTSNERRREADDELKKINQHFDILKAHFERQHRSGPGCECQPNTVSAQERNPASASSGATSRRRREWEAEQKRKQEEKVHRAREERDRQEQQAAWKAHEERQAAERAKKAMEEVDQLRHRQQQRLIRWRIAAAIALAYLLVLASSWLIAGAKNFIAGIQAATGQSQSTKSETVTPSSSDAPEVVTSTPDTSTDTGAYLPPQYHIPGKDLSWCRIFYEEEGRRLQERQEQERMQDISGAKNEIDHHQKAIDACNSSIAEIQAKLWNPDISYFEKQRLQKLIEFRESTLAAEHAGLRSAQDKLNHLKTAESRQPSLRPDIPRERATLRGGFFSDGQLKHTAIQYIRESEG